MSQQSRQFGACRGRRRRSTLASGLLVGLLALAVAETHAAESSASAKNDVATVNVVAPQLVAPEPLPPPSPTPAKPEKKPPATSPQPTPDFQSGQWVQPESAPEQCAPRRGPLRLFLDRVRADDVPRSPEQDWLYRPLSAGVFFGALFGSDLVPDWVSEKSGFLGGVRLGWDFDPYWGVEVRYAFGNVRLSDSERAVAERNYWAEAIPAWDYNENARYSSRNILDLSMLYYFRGDVRLRPYILFGVGYASLRFDDILGEHWTHSTVDMPIAIGVKYLCSDQFALRFEVNDTILVGNSDLETVHDFNLTLGLEARFGGSRRSYWPWNPGDRYR
jgi:hypothetical protein